MIYVKQCLSSRTCNMYKSFCEHLITSVAVLVCVALSVCVPSSGTVLKSHSHQSLGKVRNSVIGIICLKRAKGGVCFASSAHWLDNQL